ncbi:MAG: glycosyltransferase family 39 protein [Syntrophorhabdaceae bacterium]|nr:glycosyltransferase family 39 protein [Syntrophorhabdaceae bacterium]
MNPNRYHVVLIIIACYLLFFHNLGGIALWDPDEPRQAIMAREMMERNDYIHPYLNGAPYLEKPPFYPWMIIVASKIKGALDEVASRIPAAISATLLVLLTYYFGSYLVDRSAGLISALVLATNYQFISNGRESVMDMTFAFFIGLTIFLNYLALRKKKGFYFFLSFIPSALAILTKGPAGLILPAIVTFLYLFNIKGVKRFMLPFILGCILAASIASIWFFLAGEEYLKEFIVRQNITRYTKAFDHIEGPFYYFHKLFFNFLPWSIILPFGIVHAFKRKVYQPLFWFFAVFLFFEFSKSKRAIYLLSLYPACAMICGLFLRERLKSIIEKGMTNLLCRLFVVFLILIPPAAIIVLYLVQSDVVLVFKKNITPLSIYMAFFFILSLFLLYLVWKERPKAFLVLFFFYLISLGYFHNNFYLPLMDKNFKSPRLISDELKGLKEKREVYLFGFSSPGLIYYLEKPAMTVTKLDDIIEKKHDIILVVEDDEARDIDTKLKRFFLPVKRVQYEKERYTIYLRRGIDG